MKRQENEFEGFDYPSSLDDPKWKWRQELQRSKESIESKKHIVDNCFNINCSINSDDENKQKIYYKNAIIRKSIDRNILKFCCPQCVPFLLSIYLHKSHSVNGLS